MLAVVLVAAVGGSPATANASALTIIVGGYNSVNDPLGTPGVFVTGYFIDSGAVFIPLPGGTPLPNRYREIEATVFRVIKTAIDSGNVVNLLGYSHGATLLVRVVHQLSQARLPLNHINLITLDRISVTYPALVKWDHVPEGLALAVNVFQKLDFLHGDALGGAIDRNISPELKFEYVQGLQVNPKDPRFANDRGYHVFLQNSEYVRHLILSYFGTRYPAGLWQMRVVASTNFPQTFDFTSYYLWYITTLRRFELKVWRTNVFRRFAGVIRGASVEGELVIPTRPPADCPSLGQNKAVGTFRGTLNESYNRMTLTLSGMWPSYSNSPCRWTASRPFTGSSNAVLALTESTTQTASSEQALEERQSVKSGAVSSFSPFPW